MFHVALFLSCSDVVRCSRSSFPLKSPSSSSIDSLARFLHGSEKIDYKHSSNTSYLSSLPILAVVYRFFYLPTTNLPIYHNLPIPTNVLLFFLLFHVNYALTNVIFMYLWWKVLHHIINIIYSTLQGVGIFCI